MKTYSSGMGSRLRFAIAAASSQDILLVDEALATGDAEFRVRGSRAGPGPDRAGARRRSALRPAGREPGTSRGRACPARTFAEHPAHGPVDERLVRRPARRPYERRAVAAGAGQLDVDARAGQARRPRPDGLADRVLLFEEGDGVVVGDDQAVEAEFLAEQPPVSSPGRRRGHAVDVDVGGITERAPPSRIAISNGRQDHVRELARGRCDTGAMLRPAREAEYPAKCLSVACTPADCRPRT